MIRFRNLKTGDFVWGVYNINWDKSKPSEICYSPSEYKIQKCEITRNDIDVEETVDVGDRYESVYVKRINNYIIINFNGNHYSRRYDKFYDERGHFTLTPSYPRNGPTIEFFTTLDEAKEYTRGMCNTELKVLDEKIKDCEYRKKLLINTLEEYK